MKASGLTASEYILMKEVLTVNRAGYNGGRDDRGYWLECPGFPQDEIEEILRAVRTKIN